MKRSVIMLCVSGALLAAGLALHHFDYALPALAVCAASYLLTGWRVLWKAARNIAHGKVFDENFLMALATVGAFIVGEYPEAAAVMLFYQIGELFEHMAVRRSRRSITELMQICPDTARRKTPDGSEIVDPEEVQVGDTLLVSAGERIPLDGTVLEGSAQIDTSALTGESVPRSAAAGDAVHSGCICLDGTLEIRADKAFAESTASKILELVENAAARKSRSETFITRFAAWYTPVVVILAALLAVVPPLVTRDTAAFREWVYRALNFLVVSCPCALVISVPLSFFGGIGAASKSGVLVKGSVYLEALADASAVVFDKTGTLTQGVFEVVSVRPNGVSEQELLRYAAGAEQFSSHPIAGSLRSACEDLPPEAQVSEVKAYAGKGVGASVCGKAVLCGNAALLAENGIECAPTDGAGTHVYAAIDGRYAGCITVSDRLKPDAPAAVQALRARGLATFMLSGDRVPEAEAAAKALGIGTVHAQLLPAEKVGQLETILAGQKGKTIYVGDGINDAPVLARADVGVAMGALGSDAAIEAADVVLITDETKKLDTVMAIAQKTMRIVRENIGFTLAVKIGVLLTSAMGWTNLWLAVFADVGVCVLAILNALRALRMHKSGAAV